MDAKRLSGANFQNAYGDGILLASEADNDRRSSMENNGRSMIMILQFNYMKSFHG